MWVMQGEMERERGMMWRGVSCLWKRGDFKGLNTPEGGHE